MKIIPTYRDITVIENDPFIVIATDSSGSIGEKEADELFVGTEIAAAFCFKVCLNELFSVGAQPEIIISTVSNEFEPTGRTILTEIKKQCELYNITGYKVNGSSEENFPTIMTGFGISVVGSAGELQWKQTREGDYCYLYGLPYVGLEVLEHVDTLLNPNVIQSIRNRFQVHDFIPCGSGGIRHEIDVLCGERDLVFSYSKPKQVQNVVTLKKSAGPSTCGIFTSPEKITGENISLLGYFTEGK